MSALKEWGRFTLGALDGAMEDPDIEAIAAMYRVCFESEAYTAEFLRWKHLENPEGASLLLYARDRESGAIAAARALWRHDLKVRGARLRGWQPCDTATHPDFRRQGLFTALTTLGLDAARERGGDLVYNFPNGMSAGGYLKLGWRPVAVMVSRAQPLRPLGVAWSLFKNRGEARGGGLRFTEARAPSSSPWRAQLTERSLDDASVTGARDDAWWQWRLSRTDRDYHVVEAGDAAAIWTPTRRGGLSLAAVCDVQAASQRELLGLWRALSADARRRGAQLLTCLGAANATPFRGPLRVLSAPTPTRAQLIALPLTSAGRAACAERWALQSFDIDTSERRRLTPPANSATGRGHASRAQKWEARCREKITSLHIASADEGRS